MTDTVSQIISGVILIVLSAILAWMSHTSDRIKEVEQTIVSKEYVLEKFTGAERRIIRLENEIYILGKRGTRNEKVH